MLAATAVHNVDDAESSPNDEGAPEQALDLLRRGIGGHVKVLGRQAHHQVAHRAAHDVGLKARALQSANHIAGPLVHQRGVDAVAVHANLFALAKRQFFGFGRAGDFAQQFVDEFFDHVEERGNRSSMRHPRVSAMARRRASGLVATGWFTVSIRLRSLMESV